MASVLDAYQPDFAQLKAQYEDFRNKSIECHGSEYSENSPREYMRAGLDEGAFSQWLREHPYIYTDFRNMPQMPETSIFAGLKANDTALAILLQVMREPEVANFIMQRCAEQGVKNGFPGGNVMHFLNKNPNGLAVYNAPIHLFTAPKHISLLREMGYDFNRMALGRCPPALSAVFL